MLSCSSQQVGRGEIFSQIDFCLPENRVDLILYPGGLKVIRLFRVFWGVVSFRAMVRRASAGWARATPAGPAASRCRAVSPTSGCGRTRHGNCRATAPHGAS